MRCLRPCWHLRRRPRPSLEFVCNLSCLRGFTRMHSSSSLPFFCFFFFLNDPAPPEISPFPLPAPLPLPLHHLLQRRPQRPVAGDDQLAPPQRFRLRERFQRQVKSLVRHQPADGDEPKPPARLRPAGRQDRKSTRLNSSHLVISYAVFCLK